jgi:DNA-binding NarL/FixJ family response regulator
MAHVREHRDAVDAIVSDLVMPDGGAERLLGELAQEAPHLAAATLVLTGGAVDGPSGTFLAAHVDRVLRKPVDMASLRALIEKVRVRRAVAIRSRK